MNTAADKSIINAPHVVEESILLDATYNKITPYDMTHVTLYPHQETIVQAMLDIEHARYLVAKPVPAYNTATKSKVVIKYDGFLLSEGFGTGKTIEILEYIRRRPLPRPIPETLNCVGTNDFIRTITKKCYL